MFLLQLLPCVRLPQLGLTTLLASVEQDKWLMSLDVTKVRGRHSQCLLVSWHSPSMVAFAWLTCLAAVPIPSLLHIGLWGQGLAVTPVLY